MTATFGILEHAQVMADIGEADMPPDVRDAAKQCADAAAAGAKPSPELMQFVTHWLSRRGQQNRWGK